VESLARVGQKSNRVPHYFHILESKPSRTGYPPISVFSDLEITAEQERLLSALIHGLKHMPCRFTPVSRRAAG
jgi:hypothetical protein